VLTAFLSRSEGTRRLVAALDSDLTTSCSWVGGVPGATAGIGDQRPQRRTPARRSRRAACLAPDPAKHAAQTIDKTPRPRDYLKSASARRYLIDIRPFTTLPTSGASPALSNYGVSSMTSTMPTRRKRGCWPRIPPRLRRRRRVCQRPACSWTPGGTEPSTPKRRRGQVAKELARFRAHAIRSACRRAFKRGSTAERA
jgi:hypothetical protein